MQGGWGAMLALAVAAAGCSTNYLSVTKIEPDVFTTRDPVFLMSIGAYEKCPTPTYLDIFAMVPSMSTDDPLFKMPLIPIDGNVDDDFPERHARLIAFSLRPGKYFFSAMLKNAMPVSVPRYESYATPGETVYLGELHLQRGCALDETIELEDEYERDVARAVELNPAFAKRAITRRVLTFRERVGTHPDQTEPANPD